MEASREPKFLILLKFTKELSYQYEGHDRVLYTLYKAHRQFFAFYQGNEATDQDFLNIFNTPITASYQIVATWMGTNKSLYITANVGER